MLTQMIHAAFGGDQGILPRLGTRRRKKIWELPRRWHCPLVGTCLPVAEMRKIAARVGIDERAMSDYVLHTVFVGSCDSRTEIAELVQKFFEKRHAAVAQREKDKAIADLQRRLADAEQRSGLLGRRELELAEARRQARDYATLHSRAEAMGRRIETLEERNAANARRAAQLETDLTDARDELAAAESALEIALGIDSGCAGVAGAGGCGRTCPAEAALTGRCVLCVGGRTGLVAGYRRLVEFQGGRFLHHDGGQEESPHRIDGIVSSADAVICQSGCVSHAAYQRIKDACKKLGKPCVFVQSPGVGSFARGLSLLADAGAADGAAQKGVSRLAN
ncbi:MAG: DUF2325 domain-containing protein [Rhodocyclaceae bacterium]|nr:DUF2325 domain-containing protein [Rhodocyclaceae bacterium]